MAGKFQDFEIVEKFSYSVDGVNFSEYYSKSVFNSVLIGFTHQELTIKLFVSVKPLTKNISCVILNYVACDGVKLSVKEVQIPSEDVIVESTVNANISRYHNDLEYVQRVREVLNHTLSNNMGFNASYFRTDNKGVNHTLQSYTFHDVVEHAEIKIIMDEDSTPSNELEFDEYFMYYSGIKIYVDKTEWANNFSDLPTPKDSLYIPFFNRRFSVSKVITDRQFNNKSVNFELSLVNYVEDSSIDDTNFTSELENIEGFQDFINGAGITQDIEQTKEFIEATHTDSSVNDVVITKSGINHNYHSALKYRIEGLAPTRNKIEYNGIDGLDWLYDSPSVTSESLMLSYEFSNVSTYSLNFWISFSTISELSIFKTYNGNLMTSEFILNSDSSATLKTYSGSDISINSTTKFSDLIASAYYNFHINKTQSFISITISTFDGSSLTTEQEFVGSNSLSDNNLNKLDFLCGVNGIKLGMVKMKSSIVHKSDLINHIFGDKSDSDIFFDDSKVLIEYE